MEQLLIIAAIIVAVLLLSGSIVPPRRPNFTISDRLSRYGLSYKISVLGGRSAMVERGNGISAGSVVRALKRSARLVNEKPESGVKLEYFERVFLDNVEVILPAIEKSTRALRFGYKLGHVGGLPRIYSFCDELVRSTGGRIDEDLFLQSLRNFSSGFDLGYSELKLLYDCVIFCLCGYISAWMVLAEKRQKSFDKGVSDGKDGRFDLDSVKRNDYICGLFFGSTPSDFTAFERIAEINGIDRAAAVRVRRLFLARASAAIEQSALSIIKITSKERFPFEFSRAHEVLASDILYLESSSERKQKYLDYVRSCARSRGCSEEAAADELIKTNNSQELCNKVFKKNRALLTCVVVNVLPVVFVGLTMWLLIATSVPVFPFFCVLSLFTVYSGGYKLLSCIFADWLQPLDLVFVRPINKRLKLFYKNTRYVISCLTPLAELIAVIFCACGFSPTSLFVASAVFISDILSCIFITASEFSFKRLAWGLKALERFIVEPPVALLSVFVLIFDRVNIRIDISKKLCDAITFAFRFIVGVAVICCAAILSHSAIMIAFGAFIIMGTVSDQAKHAVRSVKRRVLKFMRNRKTDGKSVAVRGSIIPSVRFFGGETEYKASLIESESVAVVSDNRGEINAKFYSGERLERDLNISVSLDAGDSTITTEMCHGAFEKHRTVYKYVSDELELSIEILAPIDLRACLCRVTVCNRTEHKKTVELCMKCLGGDLHEVDNEHITIDKCGVTVIGENALGLFAVGQSVDAQVKSGYVQIKNIISVDGVKMVTRLVPIIVEKDIRTVMHALSQIDEDFYFYACSGAKAYARAAEESVRSADVITSSGKFSRLPVPSLNLEAASDVELINDDQHDEVVLFGSGVQRTAPAYDDIRIEIPEEDFDEQLPVGGFLQSGGLCINGDGSLMGSLSGNVLCDGESFVKISDNGATEFECKGLDQTAGFTDAYLLIEEGGAVWSPTEYPMGAGKRILYHERGCSRVICAYNGCLSSLACFHVSNKHAVVFDLQIENKTSDDRIFDIMCAFTPSQNMLSLRVVKRGVNVNMFKPDGTGFTISSSKLINDYTAYREGYRTYGIFDRASGFRSGGSSVAPAVSSQVKIAGGSKERVIFCIAAKTDELMLDRIDERSASDFLRCEIDKYDKLNEVVLSSSDKALNHVFSFAVTRSYVLGKRDEMLHGIDTHGLKLDKLLSLFKISNCDKSFLGADILLCAVARYKMSDHSAAYKSLALFVKKVISGEVFPDAMTFSLFRALVCEKLLGLSNFDGKVSIRPATCDSTPHIEFDLISGSESSHIVISDGDGDWSWFMKIGRITYLSDTIKVGEQSPIIMGRLDENGSTGS